LAEADPAQRPVPEAQAQRRPAEPEANAPQLPPLADFLLRKLGETGTMSFNDFCQHATQEGYFSGGENVDRDVHVELMNIVKAGFVRQLPDGNFARATVMDTIRLRRAI
jgi:hypothetical protein